MGDEAGKDTTTTGDVTYDLKLSENSALVQADVDAIIAHAKEQKLTNEAAGMILQQREAGAAAFKVRVDETNKPPEKYDLKLGEKTTLDETDLNDLVKFATDNKLTQKQAEVLLAQREAGATQLLARQQGFLDGQIKQWGEDVKNDPELGGDNFNGTLMSVKRAMDKFAPEGSKFAELLKASGYGNHPEFVRLMAAVGKAMKEDGHIRQDGGGNTPKDPAEALYGKKSE